MDEMQGYILGNLTNVNDALKNMSNTIRKQNRFNRRVIVFGGATAALAWMTFKYINDLEVKIDKLSNEIEELKRNKGE